MEDVDVQYGHIDINVCCLYCGRVSTIACKKKLPRQEHSFGGVALCTLQSTSIARPGLNGHIARCCQRAVTGNATTEKAMDVTLSIVAVYLAGDNP